MKIFAHRGITSHHPGNSLPAINKALLEGYGVEVDMRSTKDGYFILCHDRIISGINGGYLDVSKTDLTTWTPLQRPADMEQVLTQGLKMCCHY